jgi:glyoxylase-like metal-dependent hydrolase (beta-lactamase superfamily II)
VESTHSAQGAAPGSPDAPLVSTLEVGRLAANCYLVACPATREAVIVDPGDDASAILTRAAQLGVRVTTVLHTHGHFDHISATEAVLAGLPERVPLGGHRADAFLYTAEAAALAASFGYSSVTARAMPDLSLDDGVKVRCGMLTLQVIHTPGHTPGSIALLLEPWCLLAGDTLFRRGIGRTDLPGGDEDSIYRSITQRLYTLAPELVVYPGHGPPTTIGEERRLNPFVRA